MGPAVAYQIDPEGALVIDFVEGEIMHPETMAGHPERIKQVVETVKIVHDKAVFKHKIQVFEMLRGLHQDRAATSTPRCRAELESLLMVMDDIEKAMAPRPARDVACHNDLLCENFIVDADGKMWIIDWEYGGMTDPYFDLGDFVMEHPFSREEERLIIETYCGEHERAPLRPHDAVQDGLRRVVGRVGDDPEDRLADRLRLHGVGHGARREPLAEDGVDDADYPRWLAEA